MTNGIVPPTKNWTWVLEKRCHDCGFEASCSANWDQDATAIEDRYDLTVDSLSRYLKHDPVHHLWDVQAGRAL